MIAKRFSTDPESKIEFECTGKVITSSGAANITLTGSDYTTKAVGFSFVPELDQSAAGKVITVNIHSITYSGSTTTINIFANEIHDNTGYLAPVAWDGTVHYRFMVLYHALPTDSSTNKPQIW